MLFSKGSGQDSGRESRENPGIDCLQVRNPRRNVDTTRTCPRGNVDPCSWRHGSQAPKGELLFESAWFYTWPRASRSVHLHAGTHRRQEKRRERGEGSKEARKQRKQGRKEGRKDGWSCSAHFKTSLRAQMQEGWLVSILAKYLTHTQG